MTKAERVKELQDLTCDCKKIEDITIGHSGHIYVRLSTVYEDDDGNTELVFLVPIKTVEEVTSYKGEELKNWLENEYTSEDSLEIFEVALVTGQVFSPRIE